MRIIETSSGYILQPVEKPTEEEKRLYLEELREAMKAVLEA